MPTAPAVGERGRSRGRSGKGRSKSQGNPVAQIARAIKDIPEAERKAWELTLDEHRSRARSEKGTATQIQDCAEAVKRAETRLERKREAQKKAAEEVAEEEATVS